jgi:hypothetical protein
MIAQRERKIAARATLVFSIATAACAISLLAFKPSSRRNAEPHLARTAVPAPEDEAVATDRAMRARVESRISDVAERLRWEALESLSYDRAHGLASAYFTLARGIGTPSREAFGRIAPEGLKSVLFLFNERDVASLGALPDSGVAFDAARDWAIAELPRAFSSRAAYLGMLDAYAESLRIPFVDAPLLAPVRPGDYWLESDRAMEICHPNALDVFFNWTNVEAGIEKGPPIMSACAGIVVAVANDWKGGPGYAAYVSGGFSPRAGNGVILYEPSGKRLFAYFHLHSVEVRLGSRVSVGETIGYGGNSGANAAMDGHGRHVHIEIYDLRAERELDSWTIRRLLFGY